MKGNQEVMKEYAKSVSGGMGNTKDLSYQEHWGIIQGKIKSNAEKCLGFKKNTKKNHGLMINANWRYKKETKQEIQCYWKTTIIKGF